MALPVNYPDFERVVCAYLPDISTASSAFVAAPVRGKIVRAYSTTYNAITVADAVWTMEINGVAVGGVSVTVASVITSRTCTPSSSCRTGDPQAYDASSSQSQRQQGPVKLGGHVVPGPDSSGDRATAS